jgi:hypothetical protein
MFMEININCGSGGLMILEIFQNISQVSGKPGFSNGRGDKI